MEIINHIELLGHKAKDRVTGFSGVITSVTFDLYGCVQGLITPSVSEDGETPSMKWFDIARLKITSRKRVMELPNYMKGHVAQGKKGAAEKPLP